MNMLNVYKISSFAVGVACGLLIRRQWFFVGNLLNTKQKRLTNNNKKTDELNAASQTVDVSRRCLYTFLHYCTEFNPIKRTMVKYSLIVVIINSY